jgi:hypothetical protein
MAGVPAIFCGGVKATYFIGLSKWFSKLISRPI